LDEIADFSKEIYNPKKEPEKEFPYIEVNDVNVVTGKIEKRFRKGKHLIKL